MGRLRFLGNFAHRARPWLRLLPVVLALVGALCALAVSGVSATSADAQEEEDSPRLTVPAMPRETHKSAVLVRGRVDAAKGTKVRVDGRKVEVEDGAFATKVDGLKKGENDVRVTAITPEGERTTETVDINYTPQAETNQILRAMSLEAQSASDAGQASALEATVRVNSTEDAVDADPGDGACETATGNGVCTLRAAVQETNAAAGKDTVEVPGGDYLLTLEGRDEDASATGDLDVTNPDGMSIRGAGRDLTTVDAGGIDRAIQALSVANLEIERLTITGGDARDFIARDQAGRQYTYTGDGGGVWALNTNLALTNVRAKSNTATGDGGAVSADSSYWSSPGNSQGSLTILHSQVDGNTSENSGSINFEGYSANASPRPAGSAEVSTTRLATAPEVPSL